MKQEKRKGNSRGMLPDGHEQKNESFFKSEHALYANNRYLRLTGTQRALLHDLCATHNGRNNGDLVLTPQFCKNLNWDYGTVKKNKRALLDSGLIRLVGYKPLNNFKMMSLYAIAWRKIDEECNKYIDDSSKKRKLLDLKFDRGTE
jgi:hypothetical protein